MEVGNADHSATRSFNFQYCFIYLYYKIGHKFNVGISYFQVDYFTKYDVALNGFAMWADWMGTSMWIWAKQLMSYHNLRGANVAYYDISKPKVSVEEKPKAILTSSLACLNELFQAYNQLARKAREQGDGQTAQFIEAHMINELLVDLRVIAEVNAKLQDPKDVSAGSWRHLPVSFCFKPSSLSVPGYGHFDDVGPVAAPTLQSQDMEQKLGHFGSSDVPVEKEPVRNRRWLQPSPVAGARSLFSTRRMGVKHQRSSPPIQRRLA